MFILSKWTPGTAAQYIFKKNSGLKSAYDKWFESKQSQLPGEDEIVLLRNKQKGMCLILVSGYMNAYENNDEAFTTKVKGKLLNNNTNRDYMNDLLYSNV
eukprot:GHVP01065834.1.p1 GENE.GHVP01065834.1~~GHVP01065834.1.p1  ORF type:complete len:100 (+),score=14.71 GHVP01065834.1:328-627(+)